ncbi:TetR/AcrR family transcriptional regulator [Actinomadura kijaniata]|uniref:TetR/AcrR family transcriptional regulator n=1 Tax=Actinomadura kijaniata TaxID=46161 RepID=UPI003F1E0ED6
MPVEIDVNERLAAIAEATLDIVAAQGMDGVSIRAVAKRIGGSTTLVTNYLPTREELLRNAVEHAMRGWNEDLDRTAGGVGDRDRLLAVVRWACTTTGNDQVLRRLFLELLGRSGPDSQSLRVLRDDSRRSREEMVAAARDAGAADAGFAADVLLLVLRGFYVAGLEDPERWNGERILPLVERLVGMLTAAPGEEVS